MRESNVMATPEMILETDFFKIDFTIIFAVVMFCLTTMTTLIKIFGKKEVKDADKPGNTAECVQHLSAMKANQKDTNTNSEQITQILTSVNELKTQVATIKVEIDNSDKSLEELKEDYKGLTLKIDDLLRHLLEMLS